MPTPICHLEIGVKNMARAKRFYSGLLGWKFSPMMKGYEIFRLEKYTGGALSSFVKPGKGSFVPYFHVKSIEKTLEKARRRKAKIVEPKTEIGQGYGCFAQIRDSEGNIFGIWNLK